MSEAIRLHGSMRILDIGCGTGVNLTLPLAHMFGDRKFLGTDVDDKSIEAARAAGHPANVRFMPISALDGKAPFDCIIASEVLEHVEDPPAFLDRLRNLTRPDGHLIVTVPNGYGPFEWCALFEAVLNISGLQRILRGIKHRIPGTPAAVTDNAAATLAVSPHVNFFSRATVISLFRAAGFRVRRFRPTTVLCGYGIDWMVRGDRAVAWNAAVADRLPPWCASDWMFDLVAEGPRRPAAWKPNWWGRFRRALNRRRWGLR